MRIPLRPLLLLSAISLAFPAAALTIDNFEEGDFNVADDNTASAATFGEVSGLSSANVAGGVRLVRVRALGTTGNAVAALVTTPAPDDSAAHTVVGVPSQDTGQFAYIYDGIANGVIDGTAGTLNLDLSAFTSLDVTSVAAGVTADAQITLWSSSFSQTSSLTPLVNGTTSFLLSGFSLDLSDIQAIRVDILGIDPLEIPTVSAIAAVPEPGTGSLVATGLLGLAIRRQRSRSIHDR